MVSFNLSTPLTHHSLSSVRRSSLFQSPPSAVVLDTPKLLTPPLKCSSLNPFHQQTLTSSSSPDSLQLELSAFSALQRSTTSIRGAEADAMGVLLKERIIFLGSDIDDLVADTIMTQLLLLDAQDPTKDIRIFINSHGGSLSASIAIFDVVRLVCADVSTVALGISASTASLILGGGTKGKRFAMPNTRIMINQPFGDVSGHAINVGIQSRELMLNKESVTRIISDFTGRSFEQVAKDIDSDRYMSPIEAVEYGIIDGVIDADRIIPLMPVPERVEPTWITEEMSKDIKKFMSPEIPDDEIY